MKQSVSFSYALFLVPAFTLACGGEGPGSGSAQDDLGRVRQAVCLSDALPRVAASASSTENAGLPPEDAIDGDYTITRWASEFADPQWLIVDLGAPRYINRVVLTWEAAASADYDIQVGDSESGPWATVYTDPAANGGTDDITGLAAVGRYVRVYSRARTTGWGNSLYEIDVYGDLNAACTGGGAACGNGVLEAGEQCDDANTNSGDGCSAACQNEVVESLLALTATTNSGGWNNATAINDGSTTSKADKTSAVLEWLEFSLPEDKVITRARVFEDNAGAWNIESWNVQYWTGSAWADAFPLSPTPVAGWNAFDFTDVTTSAVRLQVQDGSHAEVMEFQVYGLPAASGPACGDGTLDVGEECDDGNTVTESCAYGQASCSVCGSACTTVAGATSFCGDGALDIANGEACDDGNTQSGDGCSDTCQPDGPQCGDGVVEGVEQCDDGNAVTESCPYGQVSCNVCAEDCLLGPGFVSYCGDGAADLANGEACDDGNTTAGDGCDDLCQPEGVEGLLTLVAAGDSGAWATPGAVIDGSVTTAANKGGAAIEWLQFNLPSATQITRARVYEDNAGAWNIESWNVQYWSGSAWVNAFPMTASSLAGWNEFDFADVVTGQVRLQVQDGGHPEVMEFELYGLVQPGNPVCGNGVLEAGEACDDGNASNTDACLATCANAACGDGFVRPGVEQCDDGNTQSGDGCSASCQSESSGSVCGNGLLESGEQCDDGNVLNGDGCSSTCVSEGGGPGCGYTVQAVSTTSASSNLGGNTATAAVDGISSTRWESVHGVDPQWFIADLGDDRFIDDISIEWESAASADFDLEVSDFSDGPWTVVKANQTAVGVGDHEVRTYSMDAMGRYVRLFSRARTTGYGVSFFEFTVRGDANAFCGNPCGNSIIDAGETCDDGNRVTEVCPYGAPSCTVCNSSCQSVAGVTTLCGNNVTDSLYEECDDGNTSAGDGCSATCQLEAGCADLLQNQGETAIDCGGPCAPCPGPGLDVRPSNPVATGCVAPDPPQTTNFKLTRVFQNITTQSPLTLKQEPAGSGRFYFLSKSGQVWMMPNDYNTTQRTLVLDVNALEGVSNNNEDGMASMAFHPNYAQNGYVYLSYIMANPYQTRLARYTTFDGGVTLDPASKLVIRDEPITQNLHHSGQINFGPDGYLYMTVGDDGNSNPNPPADWPNRVKGSLIRIDVDHPAGGKNYGIPADNPSWPDASNPAPEVFATGFRNAWRFNFDYQTGRIFLGDVGGGAREEVDIVVAGGNYGWPLIEGDPEAIGQACPNCNAFPNILPIFNYNHGFPNQDAQGNAVIGGFVYRGVTMPGLNGDYVFADFVGHEVWALHEEEDGSWTNRELVTGFNNNISSLGEDRDGELYVLSLGNNSIWKLEPAGGQTGETFPAWLSQTGCVNPGPTVTPAAGVIPYTVSQPFWSDGAVKERFIAIPDGTTIDVDSSGDWLLPEGAVLIKNFRMAGKNFETRFVVRHFGGGWSAYTYAWLADQSDAYLVGPNPLELDTGINPDIGQAWEYPGRSQCFSCHTSAANRALGPETRQMNVNEFYPLTGRTANQLLTFSALGMLTGNTVSMDPFPELDDYNTSLHRRAMSYFHVNCSNCHRPGGTGQGSFTMLFDVPFASKNLCNVEPSISSLGIPEALLIAPGEHARSVIWERMSQRDADFMPPIGSKIPDAAGAAMLQEWIDGLSGCPSP